jgi:hypothetical protein
MNGSFVKLKISVYGTLIALALTASAHAEKLAIGKYRANASAAKVFSGVVQTLTTEQYSVRMADTSQGTAQAVKMSWGSGTEYASVFITVRPDGNQSSIEATFTRHPGIVGGGSPKKWAATFENDLRKIFPDLTEAQ